MKKFLLIATICLSISTVNATNRESVDWSPHDVTIVDDLQFAPSDVVVFDYVSMTHFGSAELVQPLVLNCPDNKFKVEATPLYKTPFVDTRWVWEYTHQFNC